MDNFVTEESLDDNLENEQYIDQVDIDKVADTAINIISSILKPFNFNEVTIDEYDGDDGELILDITGDDLAVLIGRHGRTLDSIQFLVSTISRRELGFRYPVVVDIEGYKGRQRQKLETLAKSMASKAYSQKREIHLRPMTPYERRIIHISLKSDDRVTTTSEGTGNNRHIVVIPN